MKGRRTICFSLGTQTRTLILTSDKIEKTITVKGQVSIPGNPKRKYSHEFSTNWAAFRLCSVTWFLSNAKIGWGRTIKVNATSWGNTSAYLGYRVYWVFRPDRILRYDLVLFHVLEIKRKTYLTIRRTRKRELLIRSRVRSSSTRSNHVPNMDDCDSELMLVGLLKCAPSCSGEDIESWKSESIGVNTRGTSSEAVLGTTLPWASSRSRAKQSIVLRKLCSVEETKELRIRIFCGLSSQEMFL